MRFEQIRTEVANELQETVTGDTPTKEYDAGRCDVYRSESFILTMPKGIAWKCQNCGMCCKENDVGLGDFDNIDYFYVKDAIRKHNGFNHIKKKLDKEHSECIFLKNDKCSIYNMRPMTCKIYPFTIDMTKAQICKKLVLTIIIQASYADDRKSICQGFYEGTMDDKILKRLEKHMKHVMSTKFNNVYSK